MTLAQAMRLEDARLISVCGAGGKTSLIFALADEFVAAGEKVLVTTTTKMASAEIRDRLPAVAADSAEDVLAFAKSGHDCPATIAAYTALSTDGEKIIGFPPQIIDAIANAKWFDRIIAETDGSRQKPLKAPAGHEPVFPKSSDAVIMVAGLNGLGRPLHEDTLFRAALWADLTGLKIGDEVTPGSLAKMIAHPQGLARGCPAEAKKVAFLNRADSPDNLRRAQAVADALSDTENHRDIALVAGWLAPEPGVVTMAAKQVSA